VKRCFIAIEIPDANSLTKFNHLLNKDFANSDIKWVKPENMHLTLVFLGEITDEQVEAAIKVLRSVSENYNPFVCELKGFGSFGTKNNPTVLWIGIDVSKPLLELKNRLDSGLKSSGYKINENKYRPHLTLGRVKLFKNHNELDQLTGKYKDYLFLTFTVFRLILFESKLSSQGPAYTPIEICTLKAYV
jgi:RNA 2',3'-cyclic 3'-phosphodiesterase